MPSPSQRQRVPIEIDPELLDWVDQFLSNASGQIERDRTQAIEEAIYLWCQQQARRNMQQAADLYRQRQNHDETGWLV